MQGDWCAVNPADCRGYYDFMLDKNGKPIFYDYCGEVRGALKCGCNSNTDLHCCLIYCGPMLQAAAWQIQYMASLLKRLQED